MSVCVEELRAFSLRHVLHNSRKLSVIVILAIQPPIDSSMLFLTFLPFLLLMTDGQAVQKYSQRQSTPASSTSTSVDEVLITKADLEGYICSGNENDNSGMVLTLVPKATRAMPMIAKLSCLFMSLKDSGGLGPILWRLPAAEARAC